MFILYSAITPFIAFTSLLQGFELLQVMFLLVATMLASLLISMLALMISSLVRHRFWQAICTMGLLVGLVGYASVRVVLPLRHLGHRSPMARLRGYR